MEQAAQGRGSARDLLAIYLRDHRAGAAGALRLIRRARRQADREEVAATLAWLEAEVDQDRRSLDSIMERLGISPSPWKMALATIAERAARLKLNGRLVKRSPLSTLLELEALTAGVHAKRALWQSLAAVAEQFVPGGLRELDGLIDRATVQLERLQAHHDDAARHAFGASPTEVVDERRSNIVDERRSMDASLASPAPGDAIDRLLDDAEGGIEASLLDAPTDVDGTST